MKDLTLGILAHVDAGKTTLSEALLYTCGAIRKIGRVDHRDAFLDTHSMEKDRGITIYSKQAVFNNGSQRITLLDTPGHSDFSAETERVLRVLDYAVLVISGSDGVQSHSRTLWDLLKKYEVPVFIFVNKMDQPDNVPAEIMDELRAEFGSCCVDFTAPGSDEWLENVAVCSDEMLQHFLEEGDVAREDVLWGIRRRLIVPCLFGSALKLQGIDKLASLLEVWAVPAQWPTEFGARVYKISHDEKGARLTHLKVTGGVLKIRDPLRGTDREGNEWEEKVSRIRIYNGAKFEEVSEAPAGTVCAVTGLSMADQSDGFGFEINAGDPILKPVLSYRMVLPPDADPRLVYGQLLQLEDEEPELQLTWNERSHEITAEIMGEVQTEVLTSTVKQRFGIDISFADGTVMYRETISNMVEGVGHFEPLRHYAEVHLLLEPGRPGSGITIRTDCSEDELAKNWQRLIITHIAERKHRGVLTGSPITDIQITLVAGRASNKHTQGGDFRQATYRAIRQGLMEAESVLLEPYYEYTLVLPSEYVGRAMTDLDNMGAAQGEIQQDTETAVLTGRAPVSTIRNYQKDVSSYTRGTGHLSLAVSGFEPCHNAGEVIAATAYDPESDLRNPPHSVFCAHGSGFTVHWSEVKDHMHLPSVFEPRIPLEEIAEAKAAGAPAPLSSEEQWISPEEADAILQRATHANKREERRNGYRKNIAKKRPAADVAAVVQIRRTEQLDKYMLIDGYNVIFAWKELADLAGHDINAAREKLLEILDNYRSMIDSEIIAVFDAYRIQNHPVEVSDFGSIHVVYTKTAQTADTYIEKFVHDNKARYDITVVTSDGLEQIIIRGQGAHLLSSHEFEVRVDQMNEKIRSMIRDANDSAPGNRMDLSALRDKLQEEE